MGRWRNGSTVLWIRHACPRYSQAVSSPSQTLGESDNIIGCGGKLKNSLACLKQSSWRRSGYALHVKCMDYVIAGSNEETVQYQATAQNIEHSSWALRLSKVEPFGRPYTSPFGQSQRHYCTIQDQSNGQAMSAVESDTICSDGFYGTGPGDTNKWSEGNWVRGAKNLYTEPGCTKGFYNLGPGVCCGESTTGFDVDICQRIEANSFIPQIPSFSGQPRRCYGTSHNHADGQSMNAVESDGFYTESFDKVGPGDTNRLLKEITVAADKLQKEFDIGDLRSEFESNYRPLFASHCLLVPYGINDIRTAFLHGQMHGFRKLETVHLTSLDFMFRMKTLKEHQRMPLTNFIIKRGVIIHEDWENTYGNIELLEYLFEESEGSFYRAECDASYKASGAISHVAGGAASGAVVKFGVAKLAILIWKGKKLLWAEIFDGVLCKSNHHAEVLAALALLLKCEEKKFSEVKLWSDSKRVIGVINGSESIPVKDGNSDPTYLLLRSMHKKFTTLIAVHKCRELMFLADQVLKLHGISNFIVEKAIKMHSPYLKGCPLFSVTHNSKTTNVIRAFDATLQKKKKQNYNYSLESTYFCKVNKDKFEELQRLRSVLLPGSTELVMYVRKNISQHLQDQVSCLFGIAHTVSKTTISFGYSAASDPMQRKLVVVWDASVPRVDYYRPDTCIVILAEEEEIQEMKNNSISEINAEMILHLNRVVFKYK